MSKLTLDRQTLAKFLPNPEAIRAFERVFTAVGEALPSTIEEANALAGQALAAAAQALAMLAEVSVALEQLATAPTPQLPLDPDDAAPRVQLGTISPQNHDAIEITGGTIDDAPIGQAKANKGSFTTLAASGQITSTVAAGTPPLAVASATFVDNLYVARAANADDANHAAIANGLTSPNSFPADATDLDSACALANALKSAALSKGL